MELKDETVLKPVKSHLWIFASGYGGYRFKGLLNIMQKPKV
ncbi:hypothetical protein PSI23_16710 [Xenorhabdus sp. XENO-10]|uniref:Transposase n=1 Tax=Xenorhabdus yunnanensis TaxID=3025878 RepID=A0ABT5LIE3_9GAMM|nr:hypothetical protein [Xenorhabdus yunnanensis]MDC9590877.1 hypothetical protein [Xenorhabdus yunnanensis]